MSSLHCLAVWRSVFLLNSVSWWCWAQDDSLSLQHSRSWKSVGTYSSTKLIYRSSWWMTSFQRLCGLPQGRRQFARWWVEPVDDSSRVAIRSPQDVAKPANTVLCDGDEDTQLAGWLVLWWSSLLGTRADQWLKARDSKPRRREYCWEAFAVDYDFLKMFLVVQIKVYRLFIGFIGFS